VIVTLLPTLIANLRYDVGMVFRARRRHGAPDSRRSCAATCLPAALAMVLSGSLVGPSAATAQPDVHGQIERAASTRYVVLHLFNGQQVMGMFEGFIGNWRDSVDSDVRYEEWRSAHAQHLPRLGDSLAIALASGDTLRGSFRGVGPSLLALSPENTRIAAPVYFSTIVAWLPYRGTSVEPWNEIRDRLLEAPPIAGVALKQATHTVIVPRESILSAEGSSHGGSNTKVIIIAAAAVACILICAASAGSSGKSSSSSSGNWGELWSFCNNNSQLIDSNPVDGRFGVSDVTHGVVDWAPSEPRRP
jgi:hypothetical protein